MYTCIHRTPNTVRHTSPKGSHSRALTPRAEAFNNMIVFVVCGFFFVPFFVVVVVVVVVVAVVIEVKSPEVTLCGAISLQ